MTAKTQKTTKTKTQTTAQRVATVRKTILAEIRELDKARRVLVAKDATLSTMLGSGKITGATYDQLKAVSSTVSKGIAVIDGALNDRAATLVGTYTAR